MPLASNMRLASAMLFLSLFGQYCGLDLEKGRILYPLVCSATLKTNKYIVLTNFQRTKLYSFQNLSLRARRWEMKLPFLKR